ncbi:hypothetical protein GOODEAATRI_020838, partial [Goodea atripinnis]
LPSDTTGLHNNTHLPPCSSAKGCTNKPDPILAKEKLGLNQPPLPSITISTKPTCHLLEHSFAAEEDQKTPAEFTRVYTITSHHGMLMSSGQGSKESLELDILKEKSRSGGVGSSARAAVVASAAIATVTTTTTPTSLEQMPPPAVVESVGQVDAVVVTNNSKQLQGLTPITHLITTAIITITYPNHHCRPLSAPTTFVALVTVGKEKQSAVGWLATRAAVPLRVARGHWTWKVHHERQASSTDA